MTARRPAWRRAAPPVLALCASAILVGSAARFVDPRPTIGASFFFASDSPALREERRIDTLFGGQSELVVVAQAPDLASETYEQRIEGLSAAIAGLPGVVDVKSVTRGPDGVAEARESPLWRRLLLARDGSATYVIAMVRKPWPDALVARARELIAEREHEDFRLLLAGVPFTVTVMQEKLLRDFAVFGLAAVSVFSLASLLIFRSLRVSLGTLISGTAAVAATLLGLQAIGGGLGLLTANLVTIVFVLTQSHVVFLTSNWMNEASAAGGRDADEGALGRAWRATLRASAASMATTLLGFATLLFVEAKPLRELGIGGVMGTGAAFAAAYLLFPPFLVGASARRRETRSASAGVSPRAGAAIAAGCLLAGLGLWRLDTNPSLLEYFDEDGAVHAGLEELDRNGGSSPLELVLRRRDGEPVLDGDGAYERLGSLQRDLEDDPAVGRVISLPVVLAEGQRFPLASLLSENLLLDLLEMPVFGSVAGRFVTEDRRQTLFLLQMAEHGREGSRLAVVDRLREIAAAHGFEISLSGGIYLLQGRLSSQVSSSLVQSLACLALLFTAIAAWLAGSLWAALAMSTTLALAPLAVFGGMGWLGAPLDIVAAPAAAVGLGLAADAILHLAVASRRAGDGSLGEDAWRSGLHSQRAGILRATLIVAGGFALFAFSSFPPSRRFGLAVAAATLLAAPLALYALPALHVWSARLFGIRRGDAG